MTQETTKTDYPENWIFDQDGDRLEGRFIRIDEAPTRDYGPSPIVILDVDGEERTLWLLHEALRNSFREEVSRRIAGDLESGERILVTRNGTKTSASTGRRYTDYKVIFPDRPRKHASEILGAPSTKSDGSEQELEDDVPF